MPGSILGNAVRRVEDPELLLGQGTFVGNMQVDGMLHVSFVRSTIAHARLLGVDISAAEAMPGVVAVYTGDDLGLAPMNVFVALNPVCARPPIAIDRVRFVGDIVAVVVAGSKVVAADAADAIVVEYDPLPTVVDPLAACEPSAPLQFDELGTNIVLGLGDDEDAPDPLGDADVVVRGRFINQRTAVVPMEASAIAVLPPGEGAPLTLYVATQMPHGFRAAACELFGLAEREVRVVAPHVGGGFGGKAGLTIEHALTIAVGRRLGRPVTWVETRSENLVAMWHARAQVQWAEMGLRRDGTITGLRVRMLGDCGAYGSFGGSFVVGPTYTMVEGVYRVPALWSAGVAVMTNTTPMGGARGAGRPEATALLERLMDLAADEMGIDPIELRRRNLLRPDEFPHRTHTGAVYDCGDYEASLDEAVRIAGYDELLAEQQARRARGDVLQLGIGVAMYVEVTAPWLQEWASVEVHGDGTATVRCGTSAHGQGHATAFAMIVADQLGIEVEAVRVVEGDTAAIPRGEGTGGSRSMQLGGSAVVGAAEAVFDRARQLTAELLEANPSDIVVQDDGRIGVAGVPARALSWGELAQEALARNNPLAADFEFAQTDATYPFGCHLAVVEVDMETGQVELKRFIAVDDCGRIINPLIVEGQVHGGVTHGIAQALWEQVVYDDDGNPLTSTLVDYAVPSAAELPSFELGHTETHTPLNPLGAKGIGESGTVGSTPAVQNAVVDALSHLGVRHIDLPCTAERVWRAIQAACAGSPKPAWQEPPDIFTALFPRSAIAARTDGPLL